ncbi:YodC family protein [Chryseobacterium sp. Mn2064]|uniref:YodC family protein n=1 Tax=Chryseobacterium sp. Mn2064 TaxID=3395263 RepID=UPI003BE73595
MEFKIGDTVYLKSDARTIMTINGASAKGDGYYECVWFSQELLQIGHFHKDTLVKYDREK